MFHFGGRWRVYILLEWDCCQGEKSGHCNQCVCEKVVGLGEWGQPGPHWEIARMEGALCRHRERPSGSRIWGFHVGLYCHCLFFLLSCLGWSILMTGERNSSFVLYVSRKFLSGQCLQWWCFIWAISTSSQIGYFSSQIGNLGCAESL